MLKNLKDIILEKLSVDNIVIVEEFPIDGTMEDIVKFLKEQGFKQISSSGYISDLVNLTKTKCFMSDLTNIWFADTSEKKVSKDNPIFGIAYKFYNVYYPKNSNNVRSHEYIDIVENDKEEFLRELNKRFGW